MDEMEPVEQKAKYIDVPCLKKRRRALVFLADFFMTLILTISLFHLAIYPLSRVIINYDSRIDSLHQAQRERDSILYGLELLFPKVDGRTDYDTFEDNLIFTAEQYIHLLVNSQFQEKYEVFEHYFVDLKGNHDAYISFYKELDKNQGFFEIDNDGVKLKEEYVLSIAPKYNPDDTISEKGQNDYDRLESKIFAQGYQRLLSDAYETDLSHGGHSYKTAQTTITNILNGNLYLVSASVLVAYFLSWLIFHLLVPLISKSKKTLGMIILRTERVKRENFDYPSMPLLYLQSLYALAANAVALTFVPWGVIQFNELFALPILFPIGIVSLVFVLGSTAMMLFDLYNRTLADFFSRCICFDDDGFDEIIRQKGYMK